MPGPALSWFFLDHDHTQLHRLLDITGLRSIFTICPTVAFALKNVPPN